MKAAFVTSVGVIIAALSEFTTALVVQFCVGGAGHGAAAQRLLHSKETDRPTDRLHERTNDRAGERRRRRTDGNQLF